MNDAPTFATGCTIAAVLVMVVIGLLSVFFDWRREDNIEEFASQILPAPADVAETEKRAGRGETDYFHLYPPGLLL